MDFDWQGEIKTRWVSNWGWLLFLPVIWLSLRSAYSFSSSGDGPLKFEELWKPTLISIGIAFGWPILGFFIGWTILAWQSMFKGQDIYPNAAASVVVKAVWWATIAYCFVTIGFLTAFNKLEISKDVWSAVTAGIGTLPPFATVIKQRLTTGTF